jgi:CspA family cold shock protein
MWLLGIGYMKNRGENVLEGTVKRWLTGRGYGFIEPEEGDDDIFVHVSEIGGLFELREGQHVEFEVENTPKGLRAVKVNVVE